MADFTQYILTKGKGTYGVGQPNLVADDIYLLTVDYTDWILGLESDIDGKEDYLDLPPLDGDVLASDTLGTRYWVTLPTANTAPTGFEAIDEGNGLGFRLIGRDSSLYGNIGFNAVDGSYSDEISTTNGATGDYSGIVAGRNNTANNVGDFVGGGFNNTASIGYSGVVSGLNNTASQSSFVGAGTNNSASSQNTAIVGGSGNTILFGAISAFIGGGTGNSISADGARSTIAGGTINSATEEFAFIGGGSQNNSSAQYASILGGGTNEASGDYSSVSGGRGNFARSFGEWAGGLFGTDYSPNQTSGFFSGDRIFNIGNGTNDTNRSDALTVYKTGEVNAPSMATSIIDGADGNVLITKDWFTENEVGQEVGTFVPTLDLTTTTLTIGNTTGFFVRTGRLVEFTINFQAMTSTGTPTGVPVIGNLPFSAVTMDTLIEVNLRNSVFTDGTASAIDESRAAIVAISANNLSLGYKNNVDSGYTPRLSFPSGEGVLTIKGTYITLPL